MNEGETDEHGPALAQDHASGAAGNDSHREGDAGSDDGSTADSEGEGEGEGEAAAGAEGEGATPRRRRRRRRRGRNRGDGSDAPTDGAAAVDATNGDAQAQPLSDAPAQNQRPPQNQRPAQNQRPPQTQRPAQPQQQQQHQPGGGRQRDRGRPQAHAAAPTRAEDPRTLDPNPRPPTREAAAFVSLSAGLFSHLDDREVGCKLEGCHRTWTWTAAEQIQGFGQPPPKRMCAEHYAAFHTVADREVPCTNPSCEHTWTWTKAAQLALLSRDRSGSIEPPTRTCDSCAKQERELGDAEVACRVDGCRRTWTWTREAQLKHRMWLRHSGGQESAPAPAESTESDAGRRRRRRHRRGRINDGPPPRMCEPCRQRQTKLVERETSCRVHGCTRTVTIDRESQLRAWAALGTDNIDVEAPLPKRMCEVCREFCRLHSDREVACGRPGCERSWTFKTGAQLQAFLAGRFEDPLRLCNHCVETGHQRAAEPTVAGAETMPCIVSLCDGIWHYVPSMSIGPADDGDLPLDRMCDRCRIERGAGARQQPAASSIDAAPSAGDADPSDAIADASAADDIAEDHDASDVDRSTNDDDDDGETESSPTEPTESDRS